MNNFRRYDHLVQLGHDYTEGVLFGTVYVFPKLDGTNASVWWNKDEVCCGSRNRVISVGDDNAGFAAWVHSDCPKAVTLRKFVQDNPNLIVYGEWLVPHTLKTYRKEAWRRLWIFDLYDRTTSKYIPIDHKGLEGCDIIDPLCIIENPSPAQIQTQLAVNTYLVEDGSGTGEGIVIKNYAWTRRDGSQPWGKIVHNEFKENNKKVFGPTVKNGEFSIEQEIVEEFVTPTLVGKTHAKVLLEFANKHGVDTADPDWQQRVQATYRAGVIPMLLGMVFHDLIVEEGWAFIKKAMKANPVINFRELNARTIARIKTLVPDLF